MFAKQNFISILTNAILMLLAQNLLCQASFADTKSMTTVSTKSSPKPPKPEPRIHAIHRSSITIATLRGYTKVSDLKNDSLIRRLLRDAFGADSPDSNPDAEERTAANLNLDVNETLTASLIRENKFDLEQMEDFEKENIILGNLTRDNIFHLSKGNALFIPRKDIIVMTDLAEVHIGADSIVGVLKPNVGVVSIYDLEDAGNKKVSVKVGSETIKLSPGKHLILSKGADEFEKINPAHRIAFRRLETKTLPSGIHAYTTEFSISSAVLHMKPLQNILLSNNPEDRKIAARLIKNFVILEDVYGDNEPYKMPASIVTPVKISNK